MSTDLTEDADGDPLVALPRGTMLSEYRIDAVLGQGGFGITYLAYDTLLNEAVAVKEYFPNDTAVRTADCSVRPKSGRDRQPFADGLTAFLTEARIIARFHHPNIMQVRRFFEAHGTGYIVLDYEQGTSLEAAMAGAPLPEAVVVALFAGLLDGLSAVHERAILHRDLKPRNVIIREDGTPILIDFGAARDFGARDSLTVTRIASPGYSSPEQYGVGNQQGPWSDFYALGAILYRAVTGRVPSDALKRLRDDPLVAATEAAAGRYDAALLRLIDRMMQVDEARRPASAAAIRTALPALATARPVPIEAARHGPAHAPAHDWGASRPGQAANHRGGRRRWAVAALFAAMAAVAVSAVLLLREPPRRPAADLPVSGETLHEAEAAPPQTPAADDHAVPEAAPQAAAAPSGPGPAAVPVPAPAPPQPAPVEQPKPPLALAPGVVFRDCPTCPPMVVLPSGAFEMGSADGPPSEKPVHHVTLAVPFAMGQREVTFAEWEACVTAGGCTDQPSDHGWGRGDRPVIDLSWTDAEGYVAWLSKATGESYRLPSEAEWEYAARAGTSTAFWWGDAVGVDHAACADCGPEPRRSTSPAGSFPPNPFGLFDTAGNAAEWVEDCWTPNYAGAPTDGRATLTGDCGQRVLRGGSVANDARYLRSASRFKYDVDVRYYTNGFRVARDIRRP